jgi:predicted LPLAT superfamily acyltransferase
MTAQNDTPEWMQRKERGNLFVLRFMSWLSLTLGRRLSRTVVYGIALYFLLAVAPARRASRSYLERCLQRRATWADLYRHFLSFASTVHDRVFLLNEHHGLFEVRSFGTESLHARHARQEGLLLFGAHLGSFEVMRALARDAPRLKVCMAMYPENARQINSALAAINPLAMQEIIPLGKLDAILAIHSKLKQGAMVGLLADRAVGPGDYVSLPFLGAPARFPTGPFRMAAMLKHPVYFMTGLYRSGNGYDVHFELLADFSAGATTPREATQQQLMENYVTALERHCRAAPYNWFNFFDFWEPEHCDKP